VLVHLGVGEPGGFQIVNQQTQKVLLLLGGWVAGGRCARLRVDAHVSAETVEQRFTIGHGRSFRLSALGSGLSALGSRPARKPPVASRESRAGISIAVRVA
jgi:hypothetical protein